MEISHIIQKSFLNLSGQVYFEDNYQTCHQDFTADDMINLQLNFSDNKRYLFRANEEYDLLIEHIFDDLNDIDMGHQGYLKVINLIDFFNLHHLIGLNIQNIQSIFKDNRLTGITLIFEHHQIHIINLGDQIRLFTELAIFSIGD